MKRAQAPGIYMEAFESDTRPQLAAFREGLGVDSDPVAAFHTGNYAERLARERGTAGVESAYGQL